jgi:hypothetical protein
MPAGINGAYEYISLPRYICVIGPHANEKDGTSKKPIKNNKKTIIIPPSGK